MRNENVTTTPCFRTLQDIKSLLPYFQLVDSVHVLSVLVLYQDFSKNLGEVKECHTRTGYLKIDRLLCVEAVF
jgi:hypothetical protein